MRFAVVAALAVTLSACTLLVSTSDLSGAAANVAPDADSSANPLGDAAPLGETSTSDVVGVDVVVKPDGPAGCPSGKGAVMVDTGTSCIDSTEITQAQWKAFLDANVPASTQSQRCNFNSSFQPDSSGPCANTFTPQTTPNNPVVCIDWCDADAYCTWAGKHVCRGDEWIGACTKGHTQNYPYAGDFKANNCNGPDHGVAASLPVGSMKTCEGPYPGLFDMAGNVTELEGDCPGNQCNRRGGSFDSSSAAKCDFLLTGPLGFYAAFVGSRCCADR